MLSELLASVPVHGEEAGVPQRVYARVVESTSLIDVLWSHEQALEKALEVVRETRRKLEHDRENDISIIVDAVKSTAQRTGDTALLAAFEKTIRYNGQIAEKAVQTRRRNADAPGRGRSRQRLISGRPARPITLSGGLQRKPRVAPRERLIRQTALGERAHESPGVAHGITWQAGQASLCFVRNSG